MTRHWWERPAHILMIPLYVVAGIWMGLAAIYEDWKASWPA